MPSRCNGSRFPHFRSQVVAPSTQKTVAATFMRRSSYADGRFETRDGNLGPDVFAARDNPRDYVVLPRGGTQKEVMLTIRNVWCMGTSLLCGCLAGNSAMGADVHSSYNDVLEALQSARVVKVIVDLHQCKLVNGNGAGPPVLGGLVINAFNVIPDKGILFSDVHQTLDPLGNPVTAYIRYVLAENSELTLTVTRFPENGARNEDAFLCPVPDGAKFVW
jgi:hypothetical protein